MPVRLNRFLASAGLGSRRAVEELILAGRVTVNGSPGALATRVSDDDDVRLDGRPLVAQPPTYLLLNKPAGVVTTADDPQRRRTVLELVRPGGRVFPVGRLDLDTTGALLLTNDGPLADRLMHPRHGVDKTYLVTVTGRPSDETLAALARGVELEDGRTAPARVRRVAPDRFELTIHQGRKRQVRRMCKAVGHPVVTLHRSRYGPIELGNLAPGEWRELLPDEVESLRRA